VRTPADATNSPSAAPLTVSRQPSAMNCAAAGRARRPSPRGRELLVPRLGAPEQQVREVRARDEQHEHDGGLQHPHGRPRAADDLRLQRIVAKPTVVRVGVCTRCSRGGLSMPVIDRCQPWSTGSSVAPRARRPMRYR